jgi:hypothetical protein
MFLLYNFDIKITLYKCQIINLTFDTDADNPGLKAKKILI